MITNYFLMLNFSHEKIVFHEIEISFFISFVENKKLHDGLRLIER